MWLQGMGRFLISPLAEAYCSMIIMNLNTRTHLSCQDIFSREKLVVNTDSIGHRATVHMLL